MKAQDLYQIRYSSPTQYGVYCMEDDMCIREDMTEDEAYRLMSILISDANDYVN